MSDQSMNKPPVWFWLISVVALIWNLVGVMAYIIDSLMTDEAKATLSEAQQAMYSNMPSWVTGAYAIAVFGGTLGCICLLIRKKFAKQLFVLSLLAVLTRNVYLFFLNDVPIEMEIVPMILTVMVIIIGFALILFSNSAIKKNWIL